MEFIICIRVQVLSRCGSNAAGKTGLHLLDYLSLERERERERESEFES